MSAPCARGKKAAPSLMPDILAFYHRDDSERRRAEEPLECCGVEDWPQEKLDCERTQHPDATSTDKAACSDKRPVGPVRIIWKYPGYEHRKGHQPFGSKRPHPNQ